MTYRVEHGTRAQSRRLQAIELAAGARFRAVGMGDVADGEPTPTPILEDRADAGRLYVAVDEAGEPVGFLIWSPKDDRAYVEEVSVHPDHAGHRLAARMIDRLSHDVRGRHAALSLATFRDVAWNAPYYASIGFQELPRDQIGPQHAKAWRHQTENGSDMSRRLFMTRPVAPQ